MRKQLLSASLLTVALSQAFAVDYIDWVEWERVQHWAGDPNGEKKCALVVDFQDGNGPAFVWGFRWNGTATGEDLVRAVAGQSSALTAMIQYTGSMGSTLNGFGMAPDRSVLDGLAYDFDNAALAGEVSFGYFTPETSMGQDEAPGYDTPDMCAAAIERARTSGVIEHPLNAFRYGYPAYDYDYWKLDESYANEPLYRWRSGWYDGYWSYWHGPNDYDYMSYSGLGMSSTVLQDGTVQAWKWTPINGGDISDTGGELNQVLDYEMNEFSEAMHEAEKREQPVDQDNVKFWVGTGEKSATVVFQFNDGKGPENLVYGYRWSGGWDDDLKTVLSTIAKADKRMTYTSDANGIKITYDSNDNGVSTDAIDHTDTSNTWNFYVKRVIDDEFSKVNPGRWLNPNAVLILSHQEADKKEVSLPYQLFRPALDSDEVITIPKSIDYALADETLTIPLFIQVPEGATINTGFSWTRDAAVTAVTKSMGTSNLMGKVNDFKDFKATDGTVKVKGSYKLNGTTKANYYTSGECALHIVPPVRPVTSVSFAELDVTSPLAHAVKNALVYSPEDATYTKFSFSSSDTKVATANASTGAVSSTKLAGYAVITATYLADSNVKAQYNLTTALQNPVEDITFDDADADGVIRLTPKQMTGLIPRFTPEDPDIADVNIMLSGNGTAKDNYIATMYTVNVWPDGKTMTRFNELSGHRTGECLLTVKSQDGSNIEKQFRVIVEEPERETSIDYTEGTIMLNEEWFGHTNGGLNWYSPEYDIVYQAYERENPGMSFGATSQYGIIYGDRLVVSSKQAVDAGDPLPGGGRFVVADAATLKRIGSIDDIKIEGETKSADGRALCGARPGVVYFGTSNGIYVIDIDEMKILGKIKGVKTSEEDEGKQDDLYSGQVGDMTRAGKYVFAIVQNKGVFVIDTDSDEVVRSIDDQGVQGITQTADGSVWYATIVDKTGNFVRLDSESLDEAERVVVPAEIGAVSCGWGAWRTTQFTGANSVNSIFFAPGSAISNGGSGVYWRYDIDTKEFHKIADITGMEAHTPGLKQGAYGTIRYDDRNGQIIVGTTEFKASGHYRYNWTHFFDAETGELVKTIELRPYYWFQSMPIFPDKYEAELNFESLSRLIEEGDLVIDLKDCVDDRDNNPANIRFSLADAATVADTEAASPRAEVSLNGSVLTVKPLANGDHYFTLNVESNGKVTPKTIAVHVGIPTGVDGFSSDSRFIRCDCSLVTIAGYEGVRFAMFNANGIRLGDFTVDSDLFRLRPGFGNGVYLLKGSDGTSAKLYIR